MPHPRESWQIDTAHIGRLVHFFDELESTNTAALELAASEPDGFAVVADHQTAGRGQFGRVWHARPGSSLLMSVAIHPPPELSRAVVLTALAGVAVGEAIFALSGLQARLKWPNDLLLSGKKVCGILIERHAETAVIGIGLNLSQKADEFAAAGLPEATSLLVAAGSPIEPRSAATTVIRCLDQEYGRLLGRERVAVEADWKWRVGLLGRHVSVELNDGTTVGGRLVEMGFDGLELHGADGAVRALVPESVRRIFPQRESV